MTDILIAINTIGVLVAIHFHLTARKRRYDAAGAPSFVTLTHQMMTVEPAFYPTPEHRPIEDQIDLAVRNIEATGAVTLTRLTARFDLAQPDFYRLLAPYFTSGRLTSFATESDDIYICPAPSP